MLSPSAIHEPDHRCRALVLALAGLLASACAGFEGDVLVAADGARASCPPITRTILLLDSEGRLASYDPRAEVVRDRASVASYVRPADCAAAEVALALDRDGAAWIVGCDGDLLRCDPDRGACAGRQARSPLPASVHMAWASDGGGAEALFFAVPSGRSALMSAAAESSLTRFPDLDRLVAALAGWPALTGFGDQLWALFPSPPGGVRGGAMPRLVALDTASGREGQARALGAVVLEPAPMLLAAFGGDFWVLQASSTSSTSVQRVGAGVRGEDPPRPIPRRVVGAASAPCGS